MRSRLVVGVVAAVGVVLVLLAVASATLWRPDDVLRAGVAARHATVVTAAGVVELGGDPATVTASTSAGHPVVIAVGRDSDVLGWVGADPYDLLTGLAGWQALADRSVTTGPVTASAAPSPSPTVAASGAATAAAVANPAGSDLWVAQATGTGSARLTWPHRDGGWSVLVVSPDGTPLTVQLAWPRTVRTPWLWPGVIVGGLLVLVAGALAARMLLSRRRTPVWTPVQTAAVPVVGTDRPRTRRELREADRRSAPADAAPTAPSRTDRQAHGEPTVAHGERAVAEPAPVTSPTTVPVLIPPAPAADAPAIGLPGPAATGLSPDRAAVAEPDVAPSAVADPGAAPSDAESVAATPPARQTPGTRPAWLLRRRGPDAAAARSAQAATPVRPAWLGGRDRGQAPPLHPAHPPTAPTPAVREPDAPATGPSVGTEQPTASAAVLPPTVRADAWRRFWGIPEHDDAAGGSPDPTATPSVAPEEEP